MADNLEDARIIEAAIERILRRGDAPVVQLRNVASEIVISKLSYNAYLPIMEELSKQVLPEINEYLEICDRLGLRLPLTACMTLKNDFVKYHDTWYQKFVEARTRGTEPSIYTTKGRM